MLRALTQVRVNMRPRRICVVTGARADYGHLRSVIQAIASDADLTLQLVVCGQHLEERFGNTWEEIARDGFAIDARVGLALAGDTAQATAQAAARGVAGVATALEALSPDIVVLLGDRFEILAAGMAALLLSIPIAHIHGGELTESAMDDSIRHSLTKMAALHFVAAERYARRVLQLGEQPEHVFVSGAPGLDSLDQLPWLSRAALAECLGLDLSGRFFVITYHPVTLELDRGRSAVAALTGALSHYPDAAMVFTGVNSDPGNAGIARALQAFAAADPARRVVATSLGQLRYLSAVREADVVLGNSSSGLIEAPALGTPTVNVGDRQKGRLRSASVLDCAPSESSIRDALAAAIEPEFKRMAAGAQPAYGRGGAAPKIVAALKTVALDGLRVKRFCDLPP